MTPSRPVNAARIIPAVLSIVPSSQRKSLRCVAAEGVEAAVEPIETPLNPLQRRGGRAGDLLQYGDPGFHVAKLSGAANRFNGNVGHVLRSMVNHRELDAIG